MSTEKTEGLVIRQTDFSETSRVVTLFTRDFGKISALAKGARRLKGAFESALDLLTQCRLVFIRKSSGGLDLLTEAQLIARFRPAEKSLTALYGGYYVAELLSSLTEEYDPHPVLYEEAVVALARLQHANLAGAAVLRFELVLLREIGQLPALDACVACGTPAGNQESFGFWVSQGGLICRNCQKAEFPQQQLSPGTIALLRMFSREGDVPLERISLSAEQQQQMRKFLNSAITHLLGRRPKMLRYLEL